MRRSDKIAWLLLPTILVLIAFAVGMRQGRTEVFSEDAPSFLAELQDPASVDHPVVVDLRGRVAEHFGMLVPPVDWIQYENWVFVDVCSPLECVVYVYVWDGQWAYKEEFCDPCRVVPGDSS